jgi:hypothetical protein
MTDTILYAAEALHKGALVHVMGYQNHAENKATGPNAMLLPIPSDAGMGPDNMLDTSKAKNILKDYQTTIRAQQRHTRSLSKGFDERTYGSRSVQVFDKGSYTIALAEDARDLPAALGRIPEGRRPEMSAPIFNAYAQLYPGWKMALCAWDGSIDAEPLLWWYEPKDPSRLFMPALDAHDGLAPRLATNVPLDHTLVVGSVSAPPPNTSEVAFTSPLPAHLQPFLASRVTGIEHNKGRTLKNGDFSCRMANIGKGIIDRVGPPGAA